jgi:hypothetical protein
MEKNVLPTKKSMIKQISDIIKLENSQLWYLKKSIPINLVTLWKKENI